jgi:hypothetical protein
MPVEIVVVVSYIIACIYMVYSSFNKNIYSIALFPFVYLFLLFVVVATWIGISYSNLDITTQPIQTYDIEDVQIINYNGTIINITKEYKIIVPQEIYIKVRNKQNSCGIIWRDKIIDIHKKLEIVTRKP